MIHIKPILLRMCHTMFSIFTFSKAFNKRHATLLRYVSPKKGAVPLLSALFVGLVYENI